MDNGTSTFRVIIVGGGVAGLTLASSLQRTNIHCVLLEARNEIAPLEGASIAINANGGRILDQIGALDDIYNVSAPCLRFEGYKDGRNFESNDFLHLNLERSGYSLNFLERQLLLRSLYQSVPDKKSILVGKRVSRIDHSQSGVIVQCKDGTSYEGNVVIGADGVHSMVRQEMWRNMDAERPGTVSQEEINRLTAEYSCMYGISKPVKGLSQGSLNRTYGEDVSFLTTVGKHDQVFWFIFQKLERKYTVPNIPRFTKQDAKEQAEKLLARRITDEVVFQDVWDQRDTFTLAPLEEALFSKWTWGRFACIGDSAHKWTPNIGQGGNNAIEDAAAVANCLHMLLKEQVKGQLPSASQIDDSLGVFQKYRQARVEATYDISGKVTRLEALKGPVEKFLALYLFPNSGELLANNLAHSMIGAEKLDFLPNPERSYAGTMAFNQTQGVGREESLLKRSIWALPLLIIGFFGRIMLDTIIRHKRVSDVSPFTTDLDVAQSQWLPNILFPATLAPICIIWLLESNRRANTFTFARFAILFGIASQRYGLGVLAPLYLFLHYVQSPLSNFAAFDQRLINVAAARTALLALVLAYTLPCLAVYATPDWPVRLGINATWQPFPVWLAVTHYTLRNFCVRDTTIYDRIHRPSTDLPYIRFTLKTLAFTSGVLFNVSREQLLLRADVMTCMLACVIWLALLFKDLKEAEMVRMSKTALAILTILCAFVCGPGAVVALGWLWREELLASRRAKGAVVRKVESSWRSE